MRSAVIVGAGIWGSSVARRLAETGWQVTLIDQYLPGDLRQASAGETRLIRYAHGLDDWYPRLAWQARDHWHQLGAEIGEPLLLEVGLIWFARRLDGWEKDSATVLERLGIPCEYIDPADVGRYLPGFRSEGLSYVLREPNAGVLRARRAVQVIAELAIQAGARLARGVARPAVGAAVQVGDEVLQADQVIWACGAWLPKLFDLPITVTRQGTLHFAPPSGWVTPPMPAWIDYNAGICGHGAVDRAGMKVTPDLGSEPFDPDTGSRILGEHAVTLAREKLRERFPAAADAPLLSSQVCQYALTPDGEWLIYEREPGVWVLGGDSGHGFKHAPALATYVVGLLGGEYGPDERFGRHLRARE